MYFSDVFSSCMLRVIEDGTGKGRVLRNTCHVSTDTEQKYSSTHCNLGPSWGECSTTRPGCFPPGKKPRHPLYSRTGGPQARMGVEKRKPSAPSGVRIPNRTARSGLL